MRNYKLYIDVDDVVFDTSSYVQNSLNMSTMEGLWDDIESDSRKYELLLRDYSKIPLKVGAIESIKVLRKYYDVYFLSECTFFEEYISKRKVLSKILPRDRVLLLNKSIVRKYDLDLVGGILVDDNSRILNRSNASVKILFYLKVNYVEEFKGYMIYNWEELLSILKKGV